MRPGAHVAGGADGAHGADAPVQPSVALRTCLCLFFRAEALLLWGSEAEPE